MVSGKGLVVDAYVRPTHRCASSSLVAVRFRTRCLLNRSEVSVLYSPLQLPLLGPMLRDLELKLTDVALEL